MTDETTEPHLVQEGDDIEGATPETGLAVMEAQAADIAARDDIVQFTPAQKELVRQLNPSANAAELQVFLYQAGRTGLDPIAKQIYLVKRKGKMAIQTGIDGYRLIANRTGLMAGSDEPVFEVGSDGLPVKATVTVWKIAADGQRYPYTATARWSEYAPDMSQPESFMWKKMSFTMIGKCAEALALRKACPAELSGIYTDDEMAQADFSTIGQGVPETLTDYDCPACLQHGKTVKVVDNREANAAEPEPGRKRPPAWKCSAGSNCGTGRNKWGWGSWDPNEFDDRETGDGGPYGITVNQYEPVTPDRAVLEAAWDKAMMRSPFPPADPTEPPTPNGSFTVSAASAHQLAQMGVIEPDETRSITSPPTTSTPSEVSIEQGIANVVDGLDGTVVDLEAEQAWSDLLNQLSLRYDSGTAAQVEERTRRLCELMEANSLWPADSLHSLLHAWPKVDHWADLGVKANQIKFASAVARRAEEKVKASVDG